MKRNFAECLNVSRPRRISSREEFPEEIPPGFSLDNPEKPSRQLAQRVNEYGDTERQCSGCGDWMPETTDFFYRDKNGPNGLARRCIECRTPSLEATKTHSANHRARCLNVPGSFTERDLQALWVKQKGKCQWCGCSLETSDDFTYHVDHRVPLSRGGDNRASNLVLACPKCNCTKNAKMPEDFEPSKVKAQKQPSAG